jgi:GPI-anchor transamidase subunit U
VPLTIGADFNAEDLRQPLPTALLHLHAAVLLPLFHALWLISGTGNANFFYAITLVFGIANGSALTDAMRAGLRAAIKVPDGDGKDYEVIQE